VPGCRRGGAERPRSGQHTAEIAEIVAALSGLGLRLHGFGVKTLGLAAYADHLHSADSLAWSFDARYARLLPGCPHVHCGNCLRYALGWRTRLLDRLGLSAA
jgi:hypothetical protein